MIWSRKWFFKQGFDEGFRAGMRAGEAHKTIYEENTTIWSNPYSEESEACESLMEVLNAFMKAVSDCESNHNYDPADCVSVSNMVLMSLQESIQKFPEVFDEMFRVKCGGKK